MNKNRFSILAALLAVIIVSLACNFSASTANIREAFMARDQEGTDRTSTFAQGDLFYCIVLLANAPDDTIVKVIWYAVEAEGIDPNFVINETEITHGDGQLFFELRNDSLWPIGKYKAEIYLNGEMNQTVEFDVQ